MNSQVVIVLASFNGADFLGEQLDSLIAQTESQWNLLIRDDGSTDDTLAIIRNYSSKDRRIQLLPGGGNTADSAIGNFAILLESAFEQGAEYIFCCDQDDVWESKKLEFVLARLKQLEGEGGVACLVHHDLVVVNESLELVADSFVELMKLQPGDQHHPRRLISRNEVTGCALACNRALLEFALPVSGQAIMHDWWLAMCAGFFGQLSYMPNKLVKYRQHSRNTIGAKSFWRGLNPFANWFAIWRLGNEEFLNTVKQATAFHGAMTDQLKKYPGHLETLKHYSGLVRATRWQRLRTLRQCGLWRNHWLLNVVLVIRMLLLPRGLV